MNTIKKLFIFLFVTAMMSMVFSQNCTVNAGSSATICGTSTTLNGSVQGNATGTPTWTITSKPAGAPDPTISDIHSFTPNITGLTSPGNYVFTISHPCTVGTATSQVTITAPGATTGFTAGPDITNVNATTGTVTLNGVVPDGYTASWSAYNLYQYQRNGTKTNQNSQFSSTTSATTTFSLIKKANHDIDPSYVVTLRITSINNPNCWYESTAIVRFIPNPQIVVPNSSGCFGAGSTGIYLSSTSPIFGTNYPGGAGYPGNGTIVTMNVISQPAGGNIQYTIIQDGRLAFTGANVTGTYKFTITVTNSSGTYTTPEITFTNSGSAPGHGTFITASRPEQMEYYSTVATGGEVQCGMAGSTAPITFIHTLSPSDSPAAITTTVSTTGIIPPGGAPSVAMTSGAGTATRSFTATPPAGGWRVGTYVFSIRNSNGSCNSGLTYYIHISDGARPNVTVPNTTVCYPGSGVVSATIPLPEVYKQVVNSSYFQDLNGRYAFTLISKPAGSGTPTYGTPGFTETSTIIGNLTMPGEYVFKIRAYNTVAGDYIGKEYDCSGTSREGTFSIFVAAQVNANAGSDQTFACPAQGKINLNGNNPGAASTGTWTLVSKPAGAPDPIIADPSAYQTNVTGMTTTGTYKFLWTIHTGTCVSSDEVEITIDNTACVTNYCVAGCNENTFVRSSDPNTIEYDNLISVFHSSLAKEVDGTFKVWGERSGPNGIANTLSPTAITPANGYNYTGTPMRVAAGSNYTASPQFALLTTDGLYAWGSPNFLISNAIKSDYAFAKITVNGKTDGLPAGVNPADVKMMFGSYGTLSIVTCTGDAWVLSFYGAKDGDGTSDNNGTQWKRVKTDADTNLGNVVAMRGTPHALFALTSEGKLYTWGTATNINSGAPADRLYATEVIKPTGVTPKMIGMTQYKANTVLTTPSPQTYYLLATDGKLYAMGDNTQRQLGNGTTTASNTWVQPQKVTDQHGQGTGNLENITWISPNEHDNAGYAAINVLTTNNKVWAWGSNNGQMIGAGASATPIDPAYMPGNSTDPNGLSLSDEVIAIETGGHTTVNIKKCSAKFGYVGHKISGSMGDGTNNTGNPYLYSYSTSVLIVCGAEVVTPKVQDLKVCDGKTADLAHANLEATPSDIEWHVANDRSSALVANPSAVGPGTYYAFFSSTSAHVCQTTFAEVTVSYLQPGDPGFELCGEICTEPVDGNAFQWNISSSPDPIVTQDITQPASEYGFIFDIYELDNSFNLNINGTLISAQELQFQSSGTSGINVQFADGDKYEDDTTDENGNQADIWQMRGNAAHPLLRVEISPSGAVSLFGSKASYGSLFPLVLTNGNTFNSIIWNHSATNNITVTQNVIGVTIMDGYGYGRKIVPCACYKPGLTIGGTVLETKVGITSLSRAGADNADNWPMTRKGGHIALESHTKGFVPNRVAFSGGNPVGIAAANFVEGMMVYDTTNKCMKIYTLKDGDTSMAWHCVTTQACPD